MLQGDDPIHLINSLFSTLADAEWCGSDLVGRRLAACVNIPPLMVSIYE